MKNNKPILEDERTISIDNEYGNKLAFILIPLTMIIVIMTIGFYLYSIFPMVEHNISHYLYSNGYSISFSSYTVESYIYYGVVLSIGFLIVGFLLNSYKRKWLVILGLIPISLTLLISLIDGINTINNNLHDWTYTDNFITNVNPLIFTFLTLLFGFLFGIIIHKSFLNSNFKKLI